MRQVRIEKRRRPRRRRRDEVLPLDPRDPDVVRAKGIRGAGPDPVWRDGRRKAA